MKLTGEFKKAYKRALWTLSAAVVVTAATLGVIAATNDKVVKATSAADCGATSIMNCGASTSAQFIQKYEANATGDLVKIYDAFGITSARVHSLATNIAHGEVHKDGTVWLNNVQIGAGAKTAGRVNFAGSNPLKDPSGNTIPNVYSRPPSASFAVDKIDAYIGFVDGKPAFAILTACGNPVTWPLPNITFTKKVSSSDYSSWVKDATFNDGATIQYMLTVKNSGSAAATNVTVYDKLPDGQTYEAGSTTIGTTKVADGITDRSINIGTLQPSSYMLISFRAKINLPTDKCGAVTMVNTANEKNDQLGWREDTATVHVNKTCEQPKPKTVACSALNGGPAQDKIILGETAAYTIATTDDSLVSGYNYTVNGKAVTGNGKTVSVTPTTAGTYTIAATITPKAGVTNGGSTNCVRTLTVVEKEKPQPKTVMCKNLDGPEQINLGDSATYTANASDASLVASYNFTVNGSAKTANGNSMSFTPTTAGTYTIAATITPKAGVTNGGSTNCVKTLTVKELPKPVYRCDALDVSPTDIMVGDSVTARAYYTAQNGATFKRAVINFGDGTTQVVTDAKNVVATHAYNTAKDSYNVTVDIDFTVNGQIVTVKANDACSKKVCVHEKEKPVVVTKCDALNPSKTALVLGETTILTASATANNTSVSEVIFKVDGTVVQSGSTKMTYDYKPTTKGNHNVSVSIKFANGDVKGDDAACSRTITVTEQVVPVYTCDAFDATPTAIQLGSKVKVTIKYTAQNGATFEKAVVDFGEATQTVTKDQANNGTISAEYTYKNTGDYNLKGTLTFMVNGKAIEVAGAHCVGNVKVTTTPPEKCKIPGKEQYEANDTVNCKQTPQVLTAVTELPKTGAGGIAGIFAGITAAGAAVHNVLTRRAAHRQ